MGLYLHGVGHFHPETELTNAFLEELGIGTDDAWIVDPLPPYVLLVLPEGLTRTVDHSDRTAAVLWGDGAAAAVVSTRERGRAQIVGTRLASSPSGCDKVLVALHRSPGEPAHAGGGGLTWGGCVVRFGEPA